MNGSGRLYIATLFVASCCVCMAQHGKPYGLKTDFIENTEHYYKDGYPINTKVSAPQNDTLHYRAAWIRTVHPSFGWVIPNKGKNVKQTAFRIIVADNRKDISALRGNIYDSGMQYDGNSVAYVPENLNLSPDKAYYWRVLVKTNRDRSGTWSSAKLFRTFHTLNDSATSHEPLVKTLQKAKTVKDKASGIFRADFKLDAFAQPMLEITAADNAEITVLIGEKLTADGKSVDTNPGATIRGAEYKLNVKKGRTLYKIDLRPDKRNTGADAIKIPAFIGEITPFRYCEVKSKPGTVRHVKFMREAVNYPLNYDASSFKSSSTRLDSIFEFCKYSLKATSMLGIFVDGDRERIPYEADALVSMLGTYFAFGEAAMARRTVRHLLAHPTWPTEWSLQNVELAAYDYLFTGDCRLISQNYNTIEAHTLSALRCENGLISTQTGLQTQEFLKSINMKSELRDIVDWPAWTAGLNEPSGGERDGHTMGRFNSVVNAWHYRTLCRMVTISHACKKDDKAQYYRKAANDFKTAFNKSFLNESTSLYRDALDTDHSATHSNFYPAAFGMIPFEKSKSVTDYILKRGMACSVFGAQFLIDGLFRQGRGAEGIKMMLAADTKRSWVNMMRCGTTITMEDWDETFKPNLDWNHAWATSPANIAFRDILGIIPTSPAYDVFMVYPQIGELKHVSGKTTTLRGVIKEEIRVTDKKIRFAIEVPANSIADISLANITEDFDRRDIRHARVNGKNIPLERLTKFDTSYTVGSGKHVIELICR